MHSEVPVHVTGVAPAFKYIVQLCSHSCAGVVELLCTRFPEVPVHVTAVAPMFVYIVEVCSTSCVGVVELLCTRFLQAF